jgi:amicyanin
MAQCHDLYWFDSTHSVCGIKQFCGMYMYQGLQTFPTLQECQDALSPATVPPVNNSTAPSSTPTTYNLEISGMAFSNTDLHILVGDTVVWTNKDSVQHTVTSDSGGELGSAMLSNGQTYSHTFSSAGSFSYHCTPHPFMKAKVTVQERPQL